MNRLTDLVPGAVVSGQVLLGGQPVFGNGVDVVALRRRVGMVFQRPNPFPMSIRRNITLPLREHGIRPARKREAIVRHVLRAVGLWEEVADRLDDSALNLSGGQQQRLCVARALALRPEFLLMDEPCSALDPFSSETIQRLITRLRQRYTIVLVTHNLAQARRLADYTAVLWQMNGEGRLVEFGPTPRVFGAPRHELTRAYVTERTG